jgi:hypothetical protein
MGQRGRATAALVGLGLAAAAMSGCSGSGHAAEVDPVPVDPTTAVRHAADALEGAGTSKVRTWMEMASGGTRVAISGVGVFDYVKRRGELKLALPRDAVGVAEHKPITELLISRTLYMKNRGEGVPADKWVRMDTAELADGNLVYGGATDPLTTAEMLRTARGVTLVGEETLGGVRVRHYRGTADIARAAESAAPGVRGALRAAAKGFAVTAVPFEAYLDEEGRLRKVRQRFTFSDRAVVTSVTGLYRFGLPVRIRVPDEDDVYTGKIVSPRNP